MYDRFLAKIRGAYERTGLQPARDCFYENGRACPFFDLYCLERGLDADDLVDDEEVHFTATGDVAELVCDWAWSRFGQGQWFGHFIDGFDGRTQAEDALQPRPAGYKVGRAVAEALLGKD